MQTQRIEYDDAIVRKFIFASVLFGAVGLLVGVLIASQLALLLDPAPHPRANGV